MRYSADSDDDYGVTRRGNKRGTFRDDEATYAKRDRHRPRLRAEDAHDVPLPGIGHDDREPPPPAAASAAVISASVAGRASWVAAIRQGATPLTRTDCGGCCPGSIAIRRAEAESKGPPFDHIDEYRA
jgi:hypothetical protein